MLPEPTEPTENSASDQLPRHLRTRILPLEITAQNFLDSTTTTSNSDTIHFAIFRQFNRDFPVLRQEGEHWPNIALQEEFHSGMLRDLRNISDTP